MMVGTFGKDTLGQRAKRFRIFGTSFPFSAPFFPRLSNFCPRKRESERGQRLGETKLRLARRYFPLSISLEWSGQTSDVPKHIWIERKVPSHSQLAFSHRLSFSSLSHPNRVTSRFSRPPVLLLSLVPLSYRMIIIVTSDGS